MYVYSHSGNNEIGCPLLLYVKLYFELTISNIYYSIQFGKNQYNCDLSFPKIQHVHSEAGN